MEAGTDATTGYGIQITPISNVTVSGLDISGCNLGEYEEIASWFGIDLQGEIDSAVQSSISAMVANVSQTVNLPQTFSPYSGVNITYKIQDLEFSHNKYIKVRAEGALLARNYFGNYSYYTDIYKEDLDLLPPTIWPPLIENIYQITYNPHNGTTFIFFFFFRNFQKLQRVAVVITHTHTHTHTQIIMQICFIKRNLRVTQTKFVTEDTNTNTNTQSANLAN